MADPYVGEIRMAGFNFAPTGWLFCDGSTLQISQYEVLFVLVGTTYGGDGTNTFQLPDLRGRLPIHQGVYQNGDSFIVGQKTGTETVALSISQIPEHSHGFYGLATTATSASPSGNQIASPPAGLGNVYGPYDGTGSQSQTIAVAGSNVGHNNIAPCLAVNFIICYEGIFPSQN